MNQISSMANDIRHSLTFCLGTFSAACLSCGRTFLGLLTALPPALLAVFAAFLLLTSGNAYAQDSVESDRAALVAFYNATDGPNWTDNTNWLSEEPLSEWHGVATNDDGRVVFLDHTGNQLTGEIPPELGQLTQLTSLGLNSNQLTGAIPPELGQLAQLTSLLLNYNRLTGEIPVELAQLSQLQHLILGSNKYGGNQLTGEIPPELGQLTQLTSLRLSGNRLTGEIPVELGNLAQLNRLYLHSNELTGPIPSWLVNLTELLELSLWSNELTGTVPPELAPAQDRAALVVLYLQTDGPNWTDNTNWGRFYAPVSEWHGVSTDAQGRVEELRLSANGLTGTIGAELGVLTRLTGLYLNDNELTGTIPPELENLAQLQVFDIRNTGLCVTADSELHAWIATIQDFQGTATCQLVLEFAHFANGAAIVSDLVLINAGTAPTRPVLSFYDQAGTPIAAESVVEVLGDLVVREDGALSVQTELASLGELTISTHGQGEVVSGSVKVVSDGPIGGVLRFDLPGVGVAGVGASQPTSDAIFPARRQAGGISTAAAIYNPGEEAIVVSCRLMSGGVVLEEVEIPLAANGQDARFIEDVFTGTDTSDFVGLVRCTAPGEGLFAGVAVELDAANRIFTTIRGPSSNGTKTWCFRRSCRFCA